MKDIEHRKEWKALFLVCVYSHLSGGKTEVERLTMTQFGLTPKARLSSIINHEILAREVQLGQK